MEYINFKKLERSQTQFSKQATLARAFEIAKQRPRFSYELTDQVNENELVLTSLIYSKLKSKKKEFINNSSKYQIFRLRNVSSNDVYILKIILNYTVDENAYSEAFIYHGFSAKSTLVFFPKDLFIRSSWSKSNSLTTFTNILIKFRTSANEIGYYYINNNEETSKYDLKEYRESHYFYVIGQNKLVTQSGKDKLIHINDKTYNKLENKFKEVKKFNHLNVPRYDLINIDF